MANDAGPEAKQWALAATAILTTSTRREPRHDLLGGAVKSPETEGTARTILTNSWGVDSRDKLIATLEFLGGVGQTADYTKAAAAFAQATPQQQAQDPGFAFVNQYGKEIGGRGLLAWDLGRMLAVAGWGYLAGYCSEEEAWGACFGAGVRLRSAYTSWDDYAKHYRLGALFFDPNAVTQIDTIIGQLSSAPDSPWRRVSWSLDGPPPATSASPGVAPPPPASAPSAPAGVGANGVPLRPGQPGAPQSYGGVPVIAPPPAGSPSALAPIPGAPLGAPPGPGGAGGSRKGLLIGAGVAALVVVVLVIGLIVHFVHKGEREKERELREREHPAQHDSHEKHGKH